MKKLRPPPPWVFKCPNWNFSIMTPPLIKNFKLLVLRLNPPVQDLNKEHFLDNDLLLVTVSSMLPMRAEQRERNPSIIIDSSGTEDLENQREDGETSFSGHKPKSHPISHRSSLVVANENLLSVPKSPSTSTTSVFSIHIGRQLSSIQSPSRYLLLTFISFSFLAGLLTGGISVKYFMEIYRENGSIVITCSEPGLELEMEELLL